MKLLFVSSMAATGGVQRVNAVIANALATKHQVVIYSRGESSESAFPLRVPRLTDPKNENWGLTFRLLTLAGLVHAGAVRRRRYRREAAKIAAKAVATGAEAIILSSNEILFAPALRQLLPQIRLIAWLHSSAARYLTRVFIAGLRQDFLAGLAAADDVICLTARDRAAFLPYNAATTAIANPLTFVPMGLSSLERPLIAWTGRLDSHVKGLDILVQVARQLPDGWRIAVAGPGNRRSLSRLIKKYSLAHRLILRGPLSDQALAHHYQSASIALMTSRYEGFGLVLVEAMASGLPVVALRQSGSEAVTADGHDGLLADDAQQLTEALDRLIADKALRKFYQQRSLHRAQDFSLDTILKQWERLLQG